MEVSFRRRVHIIQNFSIVKKSELCNWFGYNETFAEFCDCNDIAKHWYHNQIEVFGRCEIHKINDPNYIPKVYEELTREEALCYEIMKS
jgi:hypothetical protein